jgi:hypothetical protein
MSGRLDRSRRRRLTAPPAPQVYTAASLSERQPGPARPARTSVLTGQHGGAVLCVAFGPGGAGGRMCSLAADAARVWEVGAGPGLADPRCVLVTYDIYIYIYIYILRGGRA